MGFFGKYIVRLLAIVKNTYYVCCTIYVGTLPSPLKKIEDPYCPQKLLSLASILPTHHPIFLWEIDNQFNPKK
jgi:hypothetical protein